MLQKRTKPIRVSHTILERSSTIARKLAETKSSHFLRDTFFSSFPANVPNKGNTRVKPTSIKNNTHLASHFPAKYFSNTIFDASRATDRSTAGFGAAALPPSSSSSSAGSDTVCCLMRSNNSAGDLAEFLTSREATSTFGLRHERPYMQQRNNNKNINEYGGTENVGYLKNAYFEGDQNNTFRSTFSPQHVYTCRHIRSAHASCGYPGSD